MLSNFSLQKFLDFSSVLPLETRTSYIHNSQKSFIFCCWQKNMNFPLHETIRKAFSQKELGYRCNRSAEKLKIEFPYVSSSSLFINFRADIRLRNLCLYHSVSHHIVGQFIQLENDFISILWEVAMAILDDKWAANAAINSVQNGSSTIEVFDRFVLSTCTNVNISNYPFHRRCLRRPPVIVPRISTLFLWNWYQALCAHTHLEHLN